MEDSMAHFYGTVEGKSGSLLARSGSKKSGLEVSAKSWDGEVNLRLYRVDMADCDYVEVTVGPHGGPFRTLYNGPVSDLHTRPLTVAQEYAENV